MCGIVSVIQKDWSKTITYVAEKTFRQMLFADTLRGTDGTGYFWHESKNKKTLYEKDPAPYWNAKLPNLSKFGTHATFVVGHNRKSTMGKNTVENTHPFVEGNIILVHNGTLENTWELEKEVGKTEVDSNMIAKLLTKKNPKQALEQLVGAFALVWYDTEKAKLFFARNSERPLWIVESNQFYFIVSEAKMAEWIADRNDIKITKVTEVPVGKIHALFVNKANKLQMHVTPFTPQPKKTSGFENFYGSSDYTKYYNDPPKYPVSTYQTGFIVGPYDNMRVHLANNFKKNDLVAFKVSTVYTYNNKTRIKGYTTDKPFLMVEIDDAKAVEARIGDVLSCTLDKIAHTFGEWRLNCSDPAFDLLKTGNNEIITERMMSQLEKKKCTSCGQSCGNDVDFYHVYYDEKTQSYDFLCDVCVEHFDLTGEKTHYA